MQRQHRLRRERRALAPGERPGQARHRRQHCEPCSAGRVPRPRAGQRAIEQGRAAAAGHRGARAPPGTFRACEPRQRRQQAGRDEPEHRCRNGHRLRVGRGGKQQRHGQRAGERRAGGAVAPVGPNRWVEPQAAHRARRGDQQHRSARRRHQHGQPAAAVHCRPDPGRRTGRAEDKGARADAGRPRPLAAPRQHRADAQQPQRQRRERPLGTRRPEQAERAEDQPAAEQQAPGSGAGQPERDTRVHRPGEPLMPTQTHAAGRCPARRGRWH